VSDQRQTSARRTAPLVGRAAELEEIAFARAENVPGVVLNGPSGVGKSRLAQEAVAVARDAGACVHWLQATRSAASIPLGAFVAALPATVRCDDPLELMQRAAQALRDGAGQRLLVLGVDDAQWLDQASATLVLHLASTGTAFMLATVRAGEACPDAIVSLWKDAGARRLEIGSLGEAETEELVEQMVGGPVERAARRWMAQTSRGNALYVRELVLGARADGSMQERGGLWRLPVRPTISTALSDLVTARMAGLEAEVQRALELLALGEPLRFSEMLALIESEPLAAAEARGLVSLDGTSAHAEVRLAHPLYGEVIRAGLPSVRAREVRLRLVEIVQARELPEPGDTLRVARWLTDCGETLPVQLMLTAARDASLTGDPEFTAVLASRALEAGGGFQATRLLARAHTVRGRFANAEAVLTAAEPQIETQEQALEYLEQQSEVLHWGLNRPSELTALLDRAASWWPDGAWLQRLEPLRLRVVSFERLGVDVSASNQILSTEAVEKEVRHQVEPVHVANLFYAGRTREAHELASRIRPGIPLRSLSDAIALSLWSRITLETGERWAELETWMTTALEEGVRQSDPATTGQAAYSLAALRVLTGRYLEADGLAAEAEAQFERHDPVGLLPVVTSMRVTIACFTDARTAIGPTLERCHSLLGEDGPLAHQLPYIVRARAWAVHADGDFQRARQLLLDAAQELAHSPVHAARLSYEAFRAGEPARSLEARLAELRDRCDARLVAAYAAHVAAAAADDGMALIEVADEMEQIGAVRYATEAAANAADAFAREARQDSARRAAARSSELHSRGQGGLPPSISELDPDVVKLTPREAQLVKLVSEGMSNPEIAERLVLSVRTIESHLYRAMQKLGVSDRRELR
jgi:DNA-binding CsgD family transcriptional regulator